VRRLRAEGLTIAMAGGRWLAAACVCLRLEATPGIAPPPGRDPGVAVSAPQLTRKPRTAR
jgi:hypothetical protein